MKYIFSIFTFLLLIALDSYSQNIVIKGSIVNKETKKSIPYASIKLIKEGIGRSSDANGVFHILSQSAVDTLLVTAIGFNSRRVLADRSNKMIIELQEKKVSLDEVKINSKRKTVTLNTLVKAHEDGGRIYGGTYVQIARQFTAPQENGFLEEIKIARWLRVISPLMNTYAKFRLRIYDADSITKKPSNDLYNGIIEVVDDQLTPIITVNMKPYKIYIPNKTFFIAIEWILSGENEFFDVSAKLKLVRLDDKGKVVFETVLRYNIDHQPIIKTSGLKQNDTDLTYRIYFNGQWKLVNEFPGSDPAISAKITYFN